MSKDGQIARAKSDLARHLHIDESQIRLIQARPTQWSDASLGIEDKDTFSAQVLVDGYIIELEANGRRYTYHSDESNRVVRA